MKRRAYRSTRLRARPMLQRVEDRITPVTVTTLADTGPGSLSEAITTANTNPGADTIDFSVTGKITLTAALPIIAQTLTIIGPGADKLTIDGGGAFQVLRANSTTNFTLTVQKITVANGNTGGSGGGIFLGNEEKLIIEDSRVTGNVAGGAGGGIYFFQNGALTMRRTTVDGNVSNGIYGGGGGGIYMFGATAALIESSTISGNTAGATGGGGIQGWSWSGTLELRNSTVTKNTTGAGNGGDQGGGGIRLDPAGPGVILSSSIVADNSDTGLGTAEDILCGTVSATNSLIGVSGAGSGHTLGTNVNNKLGTVATPLSPNVKALGNYGGPTPTHEPNTGSVVVNAGLSNGFLTDQRGFTRVSGAGADIGSVELDLGVPSDLAVLADVKAAGGTLYQFDVTYTDLKNPIKASTIGAGDILVTGPGGFSQVATFIKVNDMTDGSPRVGTYSIVPPGGAWDAGDNGTYTVAMQAGEVTNVLGTPVDTGPFGSFSAFVPQVYVVDTIADVVNPGDGKLSLREAIAAANGTAPSIDTISFDPVVFAAAQKITLSGTELKITDGVTIQGTGAKLLSIDGNKASRVFFVSGPGVLDVTFKNLTITNGQTNNGPTSADPAGDGGGRSDRQRECRVRRLRDLQQPVQGRGRGHRRG